MTNVLVIFAPGFEEIEALTIVDILRRSNIDVTTAALQNSPVEGAHGVQVCTDKTLEDIDMNSFHGIILPGGAPGYENLRKDNRVIELIQKAYNEKKLIAAICASPSVLADAGILNNKKCTIYPGMEVEIQKGGGLFLEEDVVIDDNIITSRGPATSLVFALKLAQFFAGKDIAYEVRNQVLSDIELKI